MHEIKAKGSEGSGNCRIQAIEGRKRVKLKKGRA